MSSGEAEADMDGSTTFSTLDYTFFILILVISAGIGIYNAILSRDKETTQEFLLGGRAMPAIPVAISLIGSIVSAIGIFGNPTEIYFFGTQFSVNILGIFPACLLVHQLILPVFYSLNLSSLSQYIDMRFKSRPLTTLTSLLLLVNIFFIMGFCLYAPSLALTTFTSLPTWASMLIMSATSTFYSAIGGVKAVVYADVLQTLVMVLGVVAIVVICCQELGGVGAVWTIADQGSRIQFFNLDPSLFVRHTFWSTPVLGFTVVLSMVGFNQAAFQRFASVGNLRVAQWLCLVFMVVLAVLWVINYLSGLVAYAAYRDCDPLTSGRIEKADQIFPYLVMDKLGAFNGLPGIFVATIYGAVLSTLSSYENSVACLIWEDFLKDRPYFSKMTSTAATTVLKIICAVVGLVGVLMGLLVGSLGSILHVANSLIFSFVGPLFGVFMAGLIAPWVDAKSVMVGFLTALSYNLWVVVGQFLRGGGSPPYLPLSVEGCPEILANFSTPLPLVPASTPTDALLNHTLLNDEATSDESEGNTIYDVSYCYFGAIGILITLVVSTLVSICTGPMCPKAVDARLVSPSFLRLHRWLWGIRPCQKIFTHGDAPEDNEADNQMAVRNMPPIHIYQ